jgi:hypothetical protein
MWQIKRWARIKEVNEGKAEALVFTIPLGFIKLVIIAHVPLDGEEKSLVYVKCVKPEHIEGEKREECDRQERSTS